MKEIKCVDTRWARQGSPEIKHRPKLVGERMKVLKDYGRKAFLLPDGTKRRPDIPSYPVVSKLTGCYHCGMMRMDYTHIGAAINRTRDTAQKKKLIAARKKLIRLALKFADDTGSANRCNFAHRASKRYLS